MIKKQILLPREAFALGNDADTFLNIQLNRTETDIKTEKIDNVFSVSGQIEKERQASLKFCIFGLVDSKYVDCGNIIVDIKDSQGLTLFLPKITEDAIAQTNISIKTFELTEGSKMSCNLYGKKKAAFSIVFEISRAELNALNAATIKAGKLPKTHSIDISVVEISKNIYHLQSVPYLFYDLEGEFVPFGTQTSDFDLDGNTIEINNDFPFLYDRHWLRETMILPAPRAVSFTTDQINIAENVGDVFVTLALDQPSLYGIEEVSVVISADNTIRNPNPDYSFETQRVKWGIGEQTKTINLLQTFDDKFVESSESLEVSIANISGCITQDGSFQKVKVTITNEDYPSEIKFITQAVAVKSDIGSIEIGFQFHKPLEVPNQSIVVYATTNSTALLNSDFSFSPTDRNVSELTVDFEEGATGGTVQLYIFDNNVYDLTKTVQVGFKNPTQNISISSVGALTDGQVMNVAILDSINTLYAQFVTINNANKSIGPFRTTKGPDSLGRYKWAIEDGNGFTAVSGKYTIVARNDGDPVLYNGKIIPKNGIMETIAYSVNPTIDLKYEFPSNSAFNANLKAYSRAKYNFEYSSGERFEVAYNASFTNFYEYYPIQVSVDKLAGPQGSKVYFFTAQLHYFKTNYVASNGTCGIGTPNSVLVSSFTNCVPFAGRNIYGTVQNTSVVTASFETATTVSHCTQFLPFGFTQLPPPPYNTNYISIVFRNFYPQSVPVINQSNILKFDSVNDTVKQGFVTLANTSNDTKNAMAIYIMNNGEVPVTIGGNIYTPGQSFVVRGDQADFNSYSVLLPANESYNVSQSKFLVCNYIISVENVKYFTNGQAVGGPLSFKFDSTNTLATGEQNSAPTYNIVTEYSNVNIVRSTTSAQSSVDCSAVTFPVNRLHPANIAIRGILLPNSLSGFRRGYFVPTSNDVGLTCITENSTRIPFLKL